MRLCTRPEPWEIGIERSGRDLLISVFQGGAIPDVAVFERRIEGSALTRRVIEAAGRLPQDARIVALTHRLQAMRTFGEAPIIEAETVAVDPSGETPIVISAEISLRTQPALAASSALRADLFALLFRGRLKITVGDHARELPEDVFVFLVAEQLAAMTLEALEAWTRGRPYYRRLTAGGAICGVKLGSEGAASLTLGIPRAPGEARTSAWTFPAVDVGALAHGIVAFGRALSRTLLRRDRSQASNLRVHAFRGRIRELSDRLRDATRNDSKINAAPESYRAFAEATLRGASRGSDAFGRTRLRFTSRWTAAVPAIDLRATFLCGDRLVIGSTREVSCLDAQTGSPLWRKACSRAVSVMTPLGLARLEPDGLLTLHELDGGDPVWSTPLAPRVGTSASGAVASAPGLPRMLIVSDGARHLAAIDLHSGEVRWRFAARRGGGFRIRRAGKPVIVASGDPALTALDVLTGEVVWRFCDRLRFASHVAVDQDALFALAGDGAFVGRGGTRLHHMDPWSGQVRWSVDLPAHVAPRDRGPRSPGHEPHRLRSQDGRAALRLCGLHHHGVVPDGRRHGDRQQRGRRARGRAGRRRIDALPARVRGRRRGRSPEAPRAGAAIRRALRASDRGPRGAPAGRDAARPAPRGHHPRSAPRRRALRRLRRRGERPHGGLLGGGAPQPGARVTPSRARSAREASFDEDDYHRFYTSRQTRVQGPREVGELAARALVQITWAGGEVRSALDVGAGPGLWRDWFARRRPEIAYRSTDVSP
ncbi:MAG: PQQ-binding-like beta-propeller repeat protein, partial [Byssovorax sp.]